MSAFNACFMLRGLETVEPRVGSEAASALSIAEALREQEKLGRTISANYKSHPQNALVS